MAQLKLRPFKTAPGRVFQQPVKPWPLQIVLADGFYEGVRSGARCSYTRAGNISFTRRVADVVSSAVGVRTSIVPLLLGVHWF